MALTNLLSSSFWCENVLRSYVFVAQRDLLIAGGFAAWQQQVVIVRVEVSVNGRWPSLCHWMGLAGGLVFDKLWHLTDSVVAWVPFGRLTHYSWSLCGFPHLCFSPFSVAISDCSSGYGGAGAGWRLSDGSQMAPGLSSGRFRLSKHYVIRMIHPSYRSVRVFRLFGLWAYHPAIDYRISPNQAVSLCRSESVQSVGCQLLSPAMKDVTEGLCNVSGAVRTNWY